MALSSNPFRPWTWFGKLWSWIFGEQNDRSYFSGASPEHSRGSGTGSTRPGTSNSRPSYYDESGGFYPGTVDSFDSQDSGFLGLFSQDGAIGSLLSSLTARLTGAHLTGAEREANEFTAQQAQINRNFQSAEADLARQWQEEQYLKYNSPAAQMQQFRDAGINPIMVAGGNMPAASTSTAAPSGSAGSSVSPSAPIDLLSGVLSALRFKAEIDNIKADTHQKETGAKKQETETEWMDKLNNVALNKGNAEIGQINANINLINEQIQNVLSETNLNNNERKMALAAQSALAFAQKSLAEKQRESLNWDMIEKQWTAQFINKFGLTPQLAGDLANAVGGIITSATKLFTFFGRKG